MLFTWNSAAVYCAFVVLAGAVPLDNTIASSPVSRSTRLAKRASPYIGDGIDITDPQRGGKLVPRPQLPETGAFSNVQQMLDYILTDPVRGIDSQSPIFSHYFNDEDRAKVKSVYAKLAGQSYEGAAELGQIRFQGVDTPGNGDDRGCDQEGTKMYTEGFDTMSPVTVVCEDAWVFPDRDDLACKHIGDTLNEDMVILGHLVLHEYSHWDAFLTEITHGEVVDKHGDNEEINGYGLYNAYNQMDKKYAPYNADSYAWYATEILWTVLCSTEYKPPSNDDSDDDPETPPSS